MIGSVPCNTVSATPPTISRPRGTTKVCVDVKCNARTNVFIRYRLGPGTVTFCNGKTETDPVAKTCEAGVNTLCESLCFDVGATTSIFLVEIVVVEPGDVEFSCPVNIKVS